MIEDVKNQVQIIVDHLTQQSQNSLQNVKRVAISEAWKVLQLTTASTIQVIEKVASDLSGSDKKTIAMNVISNFYDKVFLVVDIPLLPNFMEPFIHKNVKAFLMMLVGVTIDALVTTFRETGIFLKTKINNEVKE
jgi:hypothetical protein